MKRLLFVFIVCVCVPSISGAQNCCPGEAEVIAVHHIYSTVNPLKYIGSVAREACYNAKEFTIVEWRNLDTPAILYGCGSHDDFPARLQKRFRTQKLPQLRNEREDVVFTMPDGVTLTVKKMSVYGVR